jgi:hypothetical protein
MISNGWNFEFWLVRFCLIANSYHFRLVCTWLGGGLDNMLILCRLLVRCDWSVVVGLPCKIFLSQKRKHSNKKNRYTNNCFCYKFSLQNKLVNKSKKYINTNFDFFFALVWWLDKLHVPKNMDQLAIFTSNLYISLSLSKENKIIRLNSVTLINFQK